VSLPSFDELHRWIAELLVLAAAAFGAGEFLLAQAARFKKRSHDTWTWDDQRNRRRAGKPG